MVKNREGAEMKVTVSDPGLFVAIVKSTMADIKPGMFVGSTGMTQPDGSQKAIEVHIFPESMRGTGEGHYDWDLKPNTKMTNANVEQTVAGVDGPILSVKYKDGEKKLMVTPETAVVTYVIGSKDDLKPGTKIFVAAGKKQVDGSVQTPRVTYGKDDAWWKRHRGPWFRENMSKMDDARYDNIAESRKALYGHVARCNCSEQTRRRPRVTQSRDAADQVTVVIAVLLSE